MRVAAESLQERFLENKRYFYGGCPPRYKGRIKDECVKTFENEIMRNLIDTVLQIIKKIMVEQKGNTKLDLGRH